MSYAVARNEQEGWPYGGYFPLPVDDDVSECLSQKW